MLTYDELADDLLPYVRNLGFTHIELMPIAEHPFDGSWGYQPVGLYAPTSRFGTPDRFRAFVDREHELGLKVSKVSVRNQRWRWGSCSPNGHICLNWRLVTMPPSVRDYVMIHELMHLRRMDHSKKFWKLVAEACPDYEAARTWLRQHGRSL